MSRHIGRPSSASRRAPPTIHGQPARRPASAHRRHGDPRRQAAGDLVVDRAEPLARPPRRGCARRPARRSAPTSSPTATSVSGPRSTVMLSMLTVPDERMAAAADQHVGVVRERRAASRRRSRSAAWRPRSARSRGPAAPVARRCRPARSAARAATYELQRQRRLEPVLAGSSLERVEAVDRDAAAHHVEVRLPGRAARRRCWRRGRGRRRARTSSTNSRKRSSCAGNRSSPRSSAVAKCVISPTVFGPRRQPQRQLPVLRAEPAHPGVELHVHARRRASRHLLRPGHHVRARPRPRLAPRRA